MNRVAWAIRLEGSAAWPQSASGRDVKSDHELTMYGDAIEPETLEEEDEAIESMNRIEKCAQAAIWRRKVDAVLSLTGQEILRMMYADCHKRRENSSLFVAAQISAKTGVDIFTATDECLSEVGLVQIENHNHVAKDMLHDIMRDALKKADRAIA